jgi:hypothetical protein
MYFLSNFSSWGRKKMIDVESLLSMSFQTADHGCFGRPPQLTDNAADIAARGRYTTFRVPPMTSGRKCCNFAVTRSRQDGVRMVLADYSCLT